MDEKRLRQQGARCMDCGVPFCHTGKLISGMASGCPVNNLIPEWNDLVYPRPVARGARSPAQDQQLSGVHRPRLPRAVRRLVRARHQRRRRSRSRTSRTRSSTRASTKAGSSPSRPTTRTGKKVAVIGSGPAGLAAAAQLNKAGHTVTVFERADRPGGLLMYGIPNMKLDKQRSRRCAASRCWRRKASSSSATRRSARTSSRSCCSRISTPPSSAPAPRKPRDLPVEGRAAEGRALRDGLPDREHAGRAQGRSPIRTPISAKGKDVIVIGGGDTGTDCVGTSMRHGCKSLCRSRSCRSRRWTAPTDNPWPEWPKVYKMDYGQEEAAAKFGADPRVYLTTVKKFIGDGAGNLAGVVTVKIEWEKNDKGQFVPVEAAGQREGTSRAAGAAGHGLPRARAGAAQGPQGRTRSRAAT